MRMNVYEWDAIPGVDRRLYPLSANRAEELVRDGRGAFVTLANGRRAVQKLAPVEILAERSARNILTPFGRGPVGKVNAPPKLNYPIPAVRDYRLAWRYSFMHMPNEMSA